MGNVKALISDYNGVIVPWKDEKPIFRAIAMDLLKLSLAPFHPMRKEYPQCRFWYLLDVKKQLERMVEEYRENPEGDLLRKTYDLYNKKVIEGLETEYIAYCVNKFARKQKRKVNMELLRAGDVMQNSRNAPIAIISEGYELGIEAILDEAGFPYTEIIANDLVRRKADIHAIGFELEIYQNKDKYMKELLKKWELRNVNPDKTMFITDNDSDEPCFELVGFPVVAPSASEDFKQRAATVYKAEVAENNAELAKLVLQT